MHSIRSIAFAVSLAASPTAASAAEWSTSVYEVEGFSVDFSGSVVVAPMQLSEEKKGLMLRSATYLQDGGDAYAYIVGASQRAPNATFNFEAGVKGTMDSYKCASRVSDTSSSTVGGNMREIFALGCIDGTFRAGARFFIRDNWFYQVVYLIKSDDQAADAKHFLTSFKLLPPKN